MDPKNILIASSSVIVTAFLGSYFTAKTTKSRWYECIKPSLTPPSYVFPIVWTILYIFIAIAFSRSMTNNDIRKLFAINLILNVAWCFLYFSQKQLISSFIVISLLWITIAQIIYMTDDIITRRLMYPYLAWITFAAILNAMSISRDEKCTSFYNE